MTPPKKYEETTEQKTYLEIGPNLKEVLTRMVQKIEISSSGQYLTIAFTPICHLIQELAKKGEQNES